MPSENSASSLLVLFRQTGDEDALRSAFSAATAELETATLTGIDYVDALDVVIDVMVGYFDHTGYFSVLDCALEMQRRRIGLEGTGNPRFPDTWIIRHPSGQIGPFSREVAEPAWRLQHANGQVSEVWKDWSAWTGATWPMGWHVRRPDGVVVELEEDQWGDAWAPAEQAAAAPKDAVEGFLTIGDTRYAFTATPNGFRYAPDNGGAATEFPAQRVEIVRLMPMESGQTFTMFATGMDADDVYFTASIWGSDSTAKAAAVGSVLGARVFMME